MTKFFFFLFLFCFTPLVHAQVGDIDCDDNSAVGTLARDVRAATGPVCHSRISPRDLLGAGISCLMGGTVDVAKGMWDGIVFLADLLIRQAPAAAFNGARNLIAGFQSGRITPQSMANSIANANARANEGIWDQARALIRNFTNFVTTLDQRLASSYQNYMCMPIQRRARILCRGVSEIALLFTGVGALTRVPGAAMLASRAGAIATRVAAESGQVIRAAAATAGRVTVRAQNSARAVGRGVRAGVAAAREERVIVSAGRNLSVVRATASDGSVIYRAERRGSSVHREIPMDAKTQAIDSNTQVGREVLESVVLEQQGRGSLLFVDVNHLGRVNYFERGTRGGDEYLEAVANSLRASLRPGDMVFKNGGDELVIVLANNNPAEIQQISQRMIDAVAENPTVRDLFRREVTIIRDRYRGLNGANSVEEIPDAMRQTMSASEIQRAAGDFATYKREQLATYLEALQNQATYRGSVSLGSSLIRHGEAVGEPLARAEAQASQVKVAYKGALGHDVDKYNVTNMEELNRLNPEAMAVERWPEPVALPTVP